MSTLHVKYLLAGGGLASSAAARAIRERDTEGSMLLVGQEVHRPYQRPPLSKDFLGGRRRERQSLYQPAIGWFEQHHVALRTGCRAAHLDASRHTVSLDDGGEVSYERLLIATGSSPKHLDLPGADLPNLFYLRTIEDAERIQRAAEKAKAEGRPHDRGRGRAVVIGGGHLGVELAAALHREGLAVDLAVRHDWPWDKFAGESAGKFIALYLQKAGITVHLNSPAARLEGDGRVQRVALSPGQVLPCDFAVAAVGPASNKDLLRGSAVTVGKAILVDDHCRTNVPDVYAAGDCAAIFDPLFGKYRVMAHLDDALTTGAVAGHNMAGADEAYRAVTHFWSDVSCHAATDP